MVSLLSLLLYADVTRVDAAKRLNFLPPHAEPLLSEIAAESINRPVGHKQIRKVQKRLLPRYQKHVWL